MKVYEIAECKEYAFQISHGIYLDKAKAISVAQELCKKSYHDNRQTFNASVVDVGGDDIYVLAGLWTKETFDEWLDKEDRSGFWWYDFPFDHHGAFGVFARDVME